MKSMTVACLCGLLCVLFASADLCQAQVSSIATASQASASSGTPSTLQVRQQVLSQQVAAINSELREVRRCIRTASMSVVLRDPQGNINRVPQTDLVNCGRRLKTLVRQLASIQRKSAQLSQDAQVKAWAAQKATRDALRGAAIRSISGGSN